MNNFDLNAHVISVPTTGVARIHRATCPRIPTTAPAYSLGSVKNEVMAEAKAATCCKPKGTEAVIEAAAEALRSTEIDGLVVVDLAGLETLTARQRVYRVAGGWAIMGSNLTSPITHKRAALRLSAAIKRAEAAARKAALGL